MTEFHTLQIRRGRSRRLVFEFSPAFVWDAADDSHPLAGDLRGDLTDAVVVSDGKHHGVALRSELVVV